MSVFKDFLLAAAGAAVSLLSFGAGTPLLASFTWQAFAARTALVLGVQTYSRSQQRRAARGAAAGVQDNKVTILANDHPEVIVYGTTRVPTVLVYRANHGAKKQFLTLVLAVPCRHRLTSIKRILFDGVDIGDLSGATNGYVTAGSKWHTAKVESYTTDFDGGTTGKVITLPFSAGEIVGVDTVALRAPDYAAQLSAFGQVPPGGYVTLAQTQYVVAGNQITVNVDSSNGFQIVVTYRIRTSAKAWVYVRKNLGEAAGGTFDVDGNGTTLSSVSQWTSADKLCSIPNIVLTLEADPDGTVWANGVPQVTLIVEGAAVYDPTKDSTNGGSGAHRLANPATWEFSNNAALCWRDFMRREVGCTAAEIDDASVRAAVPVCDAAVTLRAGGTEKAFTVDGTVSTETSWQDNVETLAMAMLGNAVKIGARWSIVPFSWEAPVVTLDTPSLSDGDVVVDPRPEPDQIINSVRGRYMDGRATTESPHGLFALDDFPPVEIAAYITQDLNEKLWHDVALPLSVGEERAQRMGTFYAYRARSAMTLSATFNMDAYELAPGKRVRLPWALNGWDITQDGGTGKVFIVHDWSYEAPHRVGLLLKEDAAAYYSWDYNAAKLLDPTPNTSLPPPNYVATPANMAIRMDASTFYVAADGSTVPYAEVSWDALSSDDAHVELFWKRAADSEYRRIVADSRSTTLWIERIARGDVLSAYAIAVNAIGAQSAPVFFPRIDVPDTLAVAVRPAPLSANLLVNASFEFSADRWGTWANDSTVSRVLKEVYFGFAGLPANARLEIDSTGTGSASTLAAYSEFVTVDPGALFAAYVDALPLSVDAAISIDWYDAARAYLTSSPGTTVPGRAAMTGNPALIEQYGRSWVFANAPGTARYARFVLWATGSWTASDTLGRKYIFFVRPFLGKVPSEVLRVEENLPAWDAGASLVLGTDALLAGVATEVATKVDSTGAVCAAVPYVIAKRIRADMVLDGPTITSPVAAKMEVTVTFTVGASYANDGSARNVQAMLFRNGGDPEPDFVPMPVTRAAGAAEALVNVTMRHIFLVAANETVTPMLALNRSDPSVTSFAEKVAPSIAASNNTTDRVYGANWSVVLIKR
jgi:hypothetical protein